MGDDGWKTQPKLMSADVKAAVVKRLIELKQEQAEPFSVVLHGGEPLMMGKARLDALLGELRQSLTPETGLHIQTNGLLLSNEMLDVLAQHRVGVSISLDGPISVHDKFRVDHQDGGSHGKVIDAVVRITAHPDAKALFSGVLAVVDPESDPVAVYTALKATGAPSIDFLYRDGNRTNLPYKKASVDSVEYGAWMSKILDLYLADEAPPVIRILDDMIRLLLGGRGIKEGIGITDYGIVVIDTDGSIQKNDTLKSTYSTADRFKSPWSVLRDRLSDVMENNEFKSYHVSQRPSSATCKSCPLLDICGGGMPAHRWSAEAEFDNPTVFCADQKLLIGRMQEWIGDHKRAIA
ncbi:hypothetical protein ABENE_07685 [Asticcacaulis benevestitus DSM 16100 = ATCC BAA-896]|uniref:Radical SAM core domain-containing protein n=2 Tax=Asticcacaulis TaxID=76890 RepID=V4RMK5_9CAUL|nr:hypothetical protein ABENE_07685 [Asticcacaulis benevestitus DSM 16100 = ATCC BAA-896]